MEAMIHRASDSDVYLHEFDKKRIEFLMQQISEWSADELIALKELLTVSKEQAA
ncbi:MAG: hypothetical protein Q4C63_02555 [Eubacteriales bacterium]|nr:hypothetical protein [Eubacteriales bacterium]